VHWAQKGLNPNTILFYSFLFMVDYCTTTVFVPLGVVVKKFVYVDDGLVEAETCGRDII